MSRMAVHPDISSRQARTDQRRCSTDSTACLLSSTSFASRTSRPPSIAPSISSVLSEAPTLTAPAWQQRGFKSREAYLAALSEFAESKLYQQETSYTLKGWYGEKTMEDYKKRPTLREERKKRKECEARLSRRATMAAVEEESGNGAISNTAEAPDNETITPVRTTDEKKEGRVRRLSRVLIGGRRATIS